MAEQNTFKNKPIRQRITKTFIHTDIFGFEVPENHLIRNIPTFQSNVFFIEEDGNPQRTTTRDICHRPHDHQNSFFYDQAETLEEVPKKITKQGDHLSQSGYHPNKTLKDKIKEIYTSSIIEDEGNVVLRRSWYNDAKQIQFDKLNQRMTKAYSANRKQVQLQSNAFDFIQYNEQKIIQAPKVVVQAPKVAQVIQNTSQIIKQTKQEKKPQVKNEKKQEIPNKQVIINTKKSNQTKNPGKNNNNQVKHKITPNKNLKNK